MFLRRLFRKKCQEYKCENPFNTDVDFELLPLRQKVEILRALCDFRLDAEDVEQSLSNLDSDSLRVEPLGHDRKNSAYWYFYGTRLYREDYIDNTDSISHKQRNRPRDKKRKRRRNRVAKEEEEEKEEEEKSGLVDDENKKRESIWQVVCFTQQDWCRLVEKFRDSEYDTERKLFRTLSEDFMPEIPKLFDLKEKQQRRKLLQRNSSRVLRSHEPGAQMETVMVRSKIKTKTSRNAKRNSQSTKERNAKEEPSVINPPVQKKGRQTNNSLASAVGQIVIHTRDETDDLEKKKGISSHGDGTYTASNYSYKYGFGIEEEERRVGMHKVLESLKDHVDAWPFIDPVDEEYAPRYYSVVRKPMDLSTMEEKLDGGSYKTLSQFKRDFRLIVDNCRQYNGSDNEYTEMAINLKEAFDKAVNRYLESETSSDEDPPSPGLAPLTSSQRVTSLPSPQHNARKRSKALSKKSKSSKLETKAKTKINEKFEEEEKKIKNSKIDKKKKGKKKSRKIKEEESADEENLEEHESEDAASETGVVTKSKKTRNAESSNGPFTKTKKLSSKESEQRKKITKRSGKYRHPPKIDTEVVMQPSKDSKENKRRKEDFEEDYEPLVIAKSKSRKIEKGELEDAEVLVEKKGKSRKIDTEKMETPVIESDRIKRNRKKDRVGLKAIAKVEERAHNKIHAKEKEKEKKSKSKSEEILKNGEMKNQTDTKQVKQVDVELDTKQSNTSKKLASIIGDEDIESLDGLKDKISERRREEKLKHEKDKQKKIGKTDVHSAYSKKVPSNGSTFHDDDRINVKRPKLKKRMKEDKTVAAESGKDTDKETNENKKIKTSQSKHTKGFGKEESSAIQALNQATEQTLHDINKWLDDAPRLSEFSSGSDSPVFHPVGESNRTGSGVKTEAPRKRPSSIKIFGPHGPTRPKKIQRTIDRLQPGKSKGNLLLKKPLNLPNTNTNDTTMQSTSDDDRANKDVDKEPKLSLGTVLKNVDSIQLICKSLVSSPNPNLSNDDEEEDRTSVPVAAQTGKEEKSIVGKGTTTAPSTVAEETKDTRPSEEVKPKSATPNLSAWFKAFGAPKSKKKDEETEDGAPKKDAEMQDTFCGRQRRLSTGGSSVSESVSSFSQESSPGHASRSPQSQPVISSTEPQIRGAGFYQDALSTGNSPYNSPYYATPPRYSAQLPPTPSPQNHPMSPAYSSAAPYEQTPLYSQIPPQVYPKPLSQENSSEAYRRLSPTFSRHSPQNNFAQSPVQNEAYPPQQISTDDQFHRQSPRAMTPVYPQHSPQAPPSNYSQPSPQQPPTPNYSQPSPQQNTNYSQPSPQQVANYSQPSPQQRNSPYPPNSPQPLANYSQASPRQPSPYARSPQPPQNYSQTSPHPPAVYPQTSPQQAAYSQPSPRTHTNDYSQPSPRLPGSYSETSPQAQNYSQPSPQQMQSFSPHSPQTVPQTPPIPSPATPAAPPSVPPPAYSQPSPQGASYSQHSPQSLPNYPQSSPRQVNYSHPVHSPQTPPNYSQLSPQQPATTTNYPQRSPQASHSYSQSSPRHKQACSTQPPQQQQPSNYSQASPRQNANYTPSQTPKSVEEYPANAAASPSFAQSFEQNHPSYLQPPPVAQSTSETEQRQMDYAKSTNREKSPSVERQRGNFVVQPSETSLSLNANHHVYQSTSQYPPAYPNNFSNVDLQRSIARHGQEQQQQQQRSPQERATFTDLNESSLNVQKYAQQRSFLSKTGTANEQLAPPPPPQDQQSQLLAFQQNLAHESLYQSGFPSSSYPVPPNSRPMYSSPHYFDSKSSTAETSNAAIAGLAPVKKRIYNDSTSEPPRNPTQETVSRSGQEQFNFEPMITLPQPPPPEAVQSGQFEGAFVGGLTDPVAANPAYARLTLDLVSRGVKEQQRLLTIPRPPPTKADHLTYARSPASGSTELDLNLLQSLQSAAAKNTQGILSLQRRTNESAANVTAPVTKPKKGRKSKQQQQQEQQQRQQQERQNTERQNTTTSTASTEQQGNAGIAGFPQYPGTSADSIGPKNSTVVPPAGSAFNFAPSTSATSGPPFYDKDATAAAAAFAFLDEFRNPSSYYSMALRQQQQQQQQQQHQQQQQQQQQQQHAQQHAQQQPQQRVTVSEQSACEKLGNQPPPPRNYAPPHPFLHSAQRSAAYGHPVSAYVTPHGPNLTVDPAAYQQYLHSLYALQPPPHHHRPSWL